MKRAGSLRLLTAGVGFQLQKIGIFFLEIGNGEDGVHEVCTV